MRLGGERLAGGESSPGRGSRSREKSGEQDERRRGGESSWRRWRGAAGGSGAGGVRQCARAPSRSPAPGK